MANVNLQQALLNKIKTLSQTFLFMAESADFREGVLRNLGWNLDEVEGFPSQDFENLFSEIPQLIQAIETWIENPPQSIQDFQQSLEVVKDFFAIINSFNNFTSSFSSLPEGFVDEFEKIGEDFLNYSVTVFLSNNHPVLYASLSLMGIIEPSVINGPNDDVFPFENEKWIRHSYFNSKIYLSRIGSLLSDPVGYFKSYYFPASGHITTQAEAKEFSDKFFPRLQLLMTSLGFHVYYGMNEELATHYSAEVANFLSTTFTTFIMPGNDLDIGVAMNIAPTSPGGIMGLILKLFGEWQFEKSFENWLFKGDITGSIDALAIDKNGAHFSSDFTGSSLDINLAISRLFNTTTLQDLGSTSGTKLQIEKISFNTFYALASQKNNYGLGVYLHGLELMIKGGDGDGFLNKIIPSNGADAKIDLFIVWDTINGLHFNVSGGMEFFFPISKKVGPIDFEGITLGVLINNGDISIQGGGDIGLTIGPISASVKNIGIKADVTFPGSAANLGICDVALKFKSPTGISLEIESDTVTGGGFLNFDEIKGLYSGGLELSFSSISFSAIGILNTKLPDGSKGYSLVIIISAEFGPLPIGMGFTLNGLGGILGLNRTMNPDVLRTGIKNNTLDNILFPHDIVQNQNTIISNLAQAFPTQEGQFLIGPMAKLGWGTPTLLTIELGIMIELPDPVRLAILGVLRAILPNEDSPTLQIQVNFLGIIDFTNKYISFDATIYDSYILKFGLFGDMALRIYWGDQPNFLISVGGFHPKYTPPPLNLPQLTRLTIVLANESNLKISVETYFAVTSNSVQFGAKVAAMAKAWKIQAIGALWFDILFQFSPFHFIADMGVMFAIKMGSKNILSIYIELTLEGPNPWRAKGKGSFKILFVRVNVSFDKTFGQANVAAIVAATVDPEFTDALQNKDNWEALLPDYNNQLISWKKMDPSVSDLVVDPAGRLKFTQKVLPLNIEIAKFGNAAISDFKKYSITAITASGNLDIVTLQDFFARNEFFNMSDDDKLAKPAYELFDTGVVAGTDDIYSNYAVHRLCDYEQITIDTGYRRPELRFSITLASFNVHTFKSYISKSVLSKFNTITTQAGSPKVVLDHSNNDFILINRNDMSQVVTQSFSNSADAERVLASNMVSQPTAAADWIVANKYELAFA